MHGGGAGSDPQNVVAKALTILRFHGSFRGVGRQLQDGKEVSDLSRRNRRRREESGWWEAVRTVMGPAFWLLARILEDVIRQRLKP